MPLYNRGGKPLVGSDIVAMLQGLTGDARLSYGCLKWESLAFWNMVPIGLPFPYVPQFGVGLPTFVVPLDGRTITDPASPFNGVTLPNWNDSVFVMGSPTPTGQVTGNNTVTLGLTHLPPDSLSVTVQGASAGTPGGSVAIATTSAGTPAGSVTNAVAGAHDHGGSDSTQALQNLTTGVAGGHSHNYDRTTSSPVGASILSLGTPVVATLVQTSTATNPVADHSHSVSVPAHSHTITAAIDHTHTASFTGTALAAHGHTGTFTGSALAVHNHSATVQMNTQAQIPLNITPRTATVTWVIKIKDMV